MMPEQEMFDVAKVKTFITDHPATEQANALFRQAIDVYRNKKDFAGAQTLFVKSILLYPTAKAYYELGNASMDAKDYQKARSAFKVGEQLGFEPLSKLLYNTACAWSLSHQPDSALTYLEYAMEAGYTNGDQIMKDPDLAEARSAENFNQIYQTAMGGSGDPEKVAWQTFKRGFAKATFPVVLNRETDQLFKNREYISYDFEKFVPEMKGARFSREVGRAIYYYVQVKNENDFTTLVYTIREEMMGEGAPVGYILVSFSPKGKVIDKMFAAGELFANKTYRVATINENGRFQVKEYKEAYEHDPEKDGYENNKLKSSVLVKTLNYKIGPDGHFEQETNMLVMN